MAIVIKKPNFNNIQGNTAMYVADDLYNKNELDDMCITDVQAWKNGDKLITSASVPSDKGEFTIYKNNDAVIPENEKYIGANASGKKNGNSITLEHGYKASWTGKCGWVPNTDPKNPHKDPETATATFDGTKTTSWTKDNINDINLSTHPEGFAVALNKTTYSVGSTNVENKSNGKSGVIIIKAPKKGLIVSQSMVKPASGEDSSSAYASINFSHRIYYGKSVSNTISAGAEGRSQLETLSTASDFNPGESKLQNGRGITWKFEGEKITKPNEYLIYAYPKKLGKLTSIIMNGATPVLGAWTCNEVDIINNAGITVPLYVYVSNNPGGYPEKTSLVFS